MYKPLLLPLLLFCLSAVGQTTSQKQEKAITREVSFEPVDYSNSLPFKSIEIIDARFDTSKIGYSRKGKNYYRLVTKNDFGKALATLLNDSLQANFSPSSKRTLLIVIKRFWFGESDGTEEESKVVLDNTWQNGLYTACSFKFEIYSQEGHQYIPVIRIDSLCYRPGLDRDIFSLEAFEICLQQLEGIDFDKRWTSSKRLTRQDIDAFNTQRLSKPVFNNPEKSRGVFITFNDFLQNRSQYSEFDLDYGKQTDQLYILENGEKKLLTGFWGYCDGENYFIKSGYNFFELRKEGNSFEFWGDKTTVHQYVHHSHTGLGPNHTRAQSITGGLVTDILSGSFDKNYSKNRLRPYQIDMETGEVN